MGGLCGYMKYAIKEEKLPGPDSTCEMNIVNE